MALRVGVVSFGLIHRWVWFVFCQLSHLARFVFVCFMLTVGVFGVSVCFGLVQGIFCCSFTCLHMSCALFLVSEFSVFCDFECQCVL